MVAAFAHRDVAAGVRDDEHALHVDALERLVDIGLQWDRLAAAQSFVGTDHPVAAAILDPPVDRLGRKSAEDDAVDRADARAGEHRHRAFGDHRHIDGDAVALADAHLLERVGHADRVGEQRGIADVPHLAIGGVGFEDDRGAHPMARGDMAVERIVAKVENAVLIPFDADGIVGPARDLRWRRHPVDALCLIGPETVGIVDAGGVEPVIVGRAAMRVRGGIGGHGDEGFGGG